MADGYTMLEVDPDAAVLSGKSRTRNVDLGEALVCESMRPRVWFVEPGNDRKNFHSHSTQEELYYCLSGPGRMRIGDETLTVAEDTAIRVPPETPRKTFNDADEEHVWLVVGAPNVDDPGVVHEEDGSAGGRP